MTSKTSFAPDTNKLTHLARFDPSMTLFFPLVQYLLAGRIAILGLEPRTRDLPCETLGRLVSPGNKWPTCL